MSKDHFCLHKVNLVKCTVVTVLLISSCQHQEIGRTATPVTNADDLEKAERLLNVRHNVFGAFRDWQHLKEGFAGTLLYYFQTDGPLTAEFYKMYNGTVSLRVPETWELDCLECENDHNCTATMTVKFNTEPDTKLMQYRFVNTGFFSPYSEKTIRQSEGILAKIKQCKADNARLFDAYVQSRKLNTGAK